MPVNVEGRLMNQGVLAVRILRLLTLCMLFLAVTTAITGLWLAVAGLVVLVVCDAITTSPKAKRQAHIARLADEAYQARRRADELSGVAVADAVEAELARLQVELLRSEPELFREP
jgi:hypothetical protein